MFINSDDYRSFYSEHYNCNFDKKSISYLVVNYQKTTKLLDNLAISVSNKFVETENYYKFELNLKSLRSEYYSAICNRCMGIVFEMGRGMKNNAISDHDLFSYGEETLLKCLSSWNKDENVLFTTYFTTSVRNMLYTLVRKKHFRNWHKNLVSLDGLLNSDTFEFDPPMEKALKVPGKERKMRLSRDVLNETLNGFMYSPETAQALKAQLGITDDLVLRYLILSAKKKRFIINDAEKEALSNLKTKFEKENNQDFSNIYMYESSNDAINSEVVSVDEGYTSINNTNNIKEEILCQE